MEPREYAMALAGSSPLELDVVLSAASPDVTSAEEHRRRKELVRQRLLGGAPSGGRIGRFLLLGQLGSGAISVVYAAYDEERDRQVAVKLLRVPVPAGDVRRWREARAVARLSHPNIAAVYEMGHREGRTFIAMELVEDQPLERWLAAGPRTWEEVVEVFLQAGRGLAAAHDLGLAHGGFQPAQMVIGEGGHARVLDFGLARLAEPAGAPAYMAPEQRAGSTADARSDQFSFCLSLREALAGVQSEEEPAKRRARRDGRLPARLARVIDRGLAADPRARWPSMARMLEQLEKVRWPTRRWYRRATMLGAAALVALVALIVWDRLEQQAAYQRVLARDARLVATAVELLERDPSAAVAALREVQAPALATGWRSTATGALLEPLSSAVVRTVDADCKRVWFHHEGSHVLALLTSSIIQVQAEGPGTPVRLQTAPGGLAVPSADRDWVLTWRAGDPRLVLSRTDGSKQRTFGTPGERVASAAFSGAGTDVVTVSPEGVVRLWWFEGSQVAKTLEMPPGERPIPNWSGWTFELGPTGRHVLGTAPSSERWIWDIWGAQPPVRMGIQDLSVTTLSFSLDERWLVVMIEGGDLKLWDLDAAGFSHVLRGHKQAVTAFAFNPAGPQLATASDDGTARVWSLDGSGRSVVLRGHTAPVISIRFDPGPRDRVITASRDQTARIWSLDASGDVRVLRGHDRHVAAAELSPDGRKAVTCGPDRTLRIWDVSRHPVRTLGRHDAEIWSASLDLERRRLITAGFDGMARIWHLDGSRSPIPLVGHESPELYTALFSLDGRRVATGGADGTARIWSSDGTGAPLVLAGHAGGVSGMAFSPDGRWLATSSRTGEIRISSASVNGTDAARILEPGSGWSIDARTHSVVFSSRGDRIATDASACGGEALLRWIHGEQHSVLGSSQDDHPLALAMSPDGRIATGHADGSLRVWDANGRGPLAVLQGHSAAIHDLTFSRDGRRLLSASLDGSARLWDPERPAASLVLGGHPRAPKPQVRKAAFDAGERRVVTASADGTARVWDLDEPGRPIVLRGHEGEVRFAGFTPEGRVVTASFDGTVRLWSLDAVAADVPALREQLRQATTVCLTADQRMHYLEEPAAVAAERFAACEHAAGRGP